MKSKEIEVIKLLIENRDKELSINDVAKLLKKDYKNAHNMVKRLEKQELVNLKPFGKSHRIMLQNSSNPLIFEAEHSRKMEMLKNKNIAVMDDIFKGLSCGLYILLVFGSYAKKMQTKQSDIDLLFIVCDEAEENIEKEINSLARTLPLNLHINVFKETDFMAMKNSKKITVGSEAMKNNVILHGIEPYYEMIK